MADELGYRCSTISNYESGRNEPSIKDLIQLAKLFNVTVDYLIGATDIKRNFKDNNLFEKEIQCILNVYLKLPHKAQKDFQNIVIQIINFYYQK